MMRILKVFSIGITAVAAVIFAVSVAVGLLGQDDTLPTIAAPSQELEISCDYTQEELLVDVTAEDEKDGDLTSQILVGDFSRFIDPGVCDLTYVVFDSSEHMATLTRRVTFIDYHSPRFGLLQPLVFEEGSTNNSEVRSLFTASDMLDGSLTDWITYVETDASFSTPGDYTITMEVRNSFGDTVSYAFPIHVYEENTQNVDIQLSESLVYVGQGERFDPDRYVDSVRNGEGLSYRTSDLRVRSQVDTSAPGLYEVHYEFEGEGGQYGQTWLTVIVEEGAP